ncbi:MAG: metalloregulator ArsR/SmtB family transcription factor [Promethearchaeota archaeon]
MDTAPRDPPRRDPPDDQAGDVIDLLKLLADETRLAILGFLQGCRKTATEIQNHVGKAQPVVSQQLKALVQGDILEFEQEGSKKFFFLKHEGILDLLAIIESLVPPGESVARYLKQWADRTRFLMVKALLERGEMSTPEIIEVVEKHPSTVSQQLGVLARAGLVSSWRSGARKMYEVRDPQVRNLIEAVWSYISESQGRRSEKVLLMGLQKSGKTSIMRSLMGVRNLLDFYDLKPTRGVSRTDFTRSRHHYFIWECGGQEAYRQEHLEHINTLVRNASRLIFVVDVQDRENWELALQYYGEIIARLKNPPPGMELQVFLHKYDPSLELDEKFGEQVVDEELGRKFRELAPDWLLPRLFRTTIYTVFRQSALRTNWSGKE